MAGKAHCMMTPQDATTGAVLTSATVNVYTPGTVTPISATMYDKSGGTLSNPLTADSVTGLIDFYLNVPQEVDLTIAKAGYTTRTLSNVPVLDDASNTPAAVLTTIGDIVAASAANTPARLAGGAVNTLLHGMGAGVMPAYSALATADLAANAVTQNAMAVGVTANPTTTSATPVDLTDMAVTLTTTGGDVLVVLICAVQSSSTSAVHTFTITQDAGAETNAVEVTCPIANNPLVAVTMARYAAPAAGSHTYKGRWATNAGTATARAAQRYMLVVELKK